MHDNSIHTFYQPCACTLEDATLAQIASQIWQFASRIKPDKKIGSLHDADMLLCFFLKICLMTITQHAHIYNFHTSNLCFKEIFCLNFYQYSPYHKPWAAPGAWCVCALAVRPPLSCTSALCRRHCQLGQLLMHRAPTNWSGSHIFGYNHLKFVWGQS